MLTRRTRAFAAETLLMEYREISFAHTWFYPGFLGPTPILLAPTVQESLEILAFLGVFQGGNTEPIKTLVRVVQGTQAEYLAKHKAAMENPVGAFLMTNVGREPKYTKECVCFVFTRLVEGNLEKLRYYYTAAQSQHERNFYEFRADMHEFMSVCLDTEIVLNDIEMEVEKLTRDMRINHLHKMTKDAVSIGDARKCMCTFLYLFVCRYSRRRHGLHERAMSSAMT